MGLWCCFTRAQSFYNFFWSDELLKVLCRYYANKYTLVGVIKILASKSSNLRFYCLEGSLLSQKGDYTVTSNTITVMVSYIDNSDGLTYQVILTSTPDNEKYNGKYISVHDVLRSNIYVELMNHIVARYVVTGKEFSVKFSIPSGYVTIKTIGFDITNFEKAAKDSDRKHIVTREGLELCCEMDTNTGKMFTTNEEFIQGILQTATGISSFSTLSRYGHGLQYTMAVQEVHIYLDIADYLNKTVCLLCSKTSDTSDDFVEYYFGTKSNRQEDSKDILEVSTVNNRRSYKKCKRNIVLGKQLVLYLTNSTIQSIAQQQRGKRQKSDSVL